MENISVAINIFFNTFKMLFFLLEIRQMMMMMMIRISRILFMIFDFTSGFPKANGQIQLLEIVNDIF